MLRLFALCCICISVTESVLAQHHTPMGHGLRTLGTIRTHGRPRAAKMKMPEALKPDASKEWMGKFHIDTIEAGRIRKTSPSSRYFTEGENVASKREVPSTSLFSKDRSITTGTKLTLPAGSQVEQIIDRTTMIVRVPIDGSQTAKARVTGTLVSKLDDGQTLEEMYLQANGTSSWTTVEGLQESIKNFSFVGISSPTSRTVSSSLYRSSSQRRGYAFEMEDMGMDIGVGGTSYGMSSTDEYGRSESQSSTGGPPYLRTWMLGDTGITKKASFYYYHSGTPGSPCKIVQLLDANWDLFDAELSSLSKKDQAHVQSLLRIWHDVRRYSRQN